ncbi:hypothetical protein BD779DRAFT_1676560 [Infundibulicybe gibba]|nr:hypothetical protein BD779DRAFT_1676560 [Infundibulicybe gibba]
MASGVLDVSINHFVTYNKTLLTLPGEPETHVQLCHAKISQLQGRLLTVLDVLDRIQITNNEALQSEKLLQNKLHQKLNRYQDVVRDLEEERDDLRDAVIQLIDRVEQSTASDFSSWSCSRMVMPSFVEECNVRGRHIGAVLMSEQELSAARSIIESLCRERDSERATHARALQDSKYRIRILEAKLARREAELAKSVEFSCQWFQSPMNTLTSVDGITTDELLSPSEIVSVLNENTSCNTKLEVEIEVLGQQLEDARVTRCESNTSDTSLRHIVEETEQFREGPSGLSHIQKLLLPRVVSSDAVRTKASDASLPLMPGPRVLASSFKDVGYYNDSHSIKHLNRQLEDFASSVELFTKEREAIIRILGQERFVPVVSVKDVPSATSLPALGHSIQGGNSGIIRDQNFDDGMSRTHQFSDDGCERESAGPTIYSSKFLDDSDGEASMELSTPLVSTNLLPGSGPCAQAPDIPQPINPHGISGDYHDLDQHQSESAAHARASPAELRLQDVEREITIAQHRLGCGEMTLAMIQKDLDHFHRSST